MSEGGGAGEADGGGAGEGRRVAAAVWRTTPALVTALDDRFGEPIDAYVNGSQVWLRDDGPGGVTLEWRLHPVAGYQRPKGMATEEVWSTVSGALALSGGEPAASGEVTASGEAGPGASEVPEPGASGVPEPGALWDGLEAFAAYGDALEVGALAAAVTSSLGIAPDAAGLVDHEPVNEEWARTGGNVSIVDDLLRQLAASPEG